MVNFVIWAKTYDDANKAISFVNEHGVDIGKRKRIRIGPNAYDGDYHYRVVFNGTTEQRDAIFDKYEHDNKSCAYYKD